VKLSMREIGCANLKVSNKIGMIDNYSDILDYNTGVTALVHYDKFIYDLGS
jgi:hypothetical protein